MIDSMEVRLDQAMTQREMVEAMLAGIDAFDRYRDALPLQPLGYTRTLLRKTRDFELVAMHWASGSKSAIHDHGTSRCWVVVVDGMLDVENYDRRDDGGATADIALSSNVVIERGELDHRLNWRELHRVSNTRDRSAYSLQIYSPKLETYTVVNEHTGLCLPTQALYDFIVDL